MPPEATGDFVNKGLKRPSEKSFLAVCCVEKNDFMNKGLKLDREFLHIAGYG